MRVESTGQDLRRALAASLAMGCPGHPCLEYLWRVHGDFEEIPGRRAFVERSPGKEGGAEAPYCGDILSGSP